MANLLEVSVFGDGAMVAGFQFAYKSGLRNNPQIPGGSSCRCAAQSHRWPPSPTDWDPDRFKSSGLLLCNAEPSLLASLLDAYKKTDGWVIKFSAACLWFEDWKYMSIIATSRWRVRPIFEAIVMAHCLSSAPGSIDTYFLAIARLVSLESCWQAVFGGLC